MLLALQIQAEQRRKNEEEAEEQEDLKRRKQSKEHKEEQETNSIFYKHLPMYNPQMKSGKPYVRRGSKSEPTTNYGKFKTDVKTINSGTRYPLKTIRFNSPMRTVHPTQKPVPLLEYLIKTCTNEGMTVLDNCMGSGSTGVAAKQLNRNFIGMELDKEYFEIAKQRIKEA